MNTWLALLRGSRTLKTRVATKVALVFGLAVAALLAFLLHDTRASMVQMLTAQQNTLVTRAAEEIDEKFRDRRLALSEVAQSLASHLEGEPAAASYHLRERKALATMFDVIFIFSPEGRALAAQPDLAEVRGLDISRRAYFIQTVQERRAIISPPYLSPAAQKPFVMMTMPMFDSNGQLIAVLAGVISLHKPNFLGEIGQTPVGRTGYFFVVTRGAKPIVVNHPDKNRILKPTSGDDGPGARAQAGFEGTIEGVNSRGIGGLMSFKRLRETDWILGAVLPTDEAFEPIQRSQRKTLLAGALGVLGIAAAVWLLVRRGLRPLDALRANVRQRIDNPHGAATLPATRHDEIGELTFDFNRLMAAQRAAETALAAGEERLATITDNVPVLIGYVDQELRYRFNNQAYEEWFGLRREQLHGRTMREVLGEQDYARIEEQLLHALDGYVVNFEREIVLGGRRRYIVTNYLPHYGPGQRVLGLYILVNDITARKTAEDKLDYLAHHDPLTTLLNRAAFNQRLALAALRVQRNRKACALMYLDIDKFKSINDTYGHGIGDSLLKAFSLRLLAAVRTTDTVGRLGGDEFVILLEDLAAPEDAYSVGSKIVEAMRDAFNLDGAVVHATTSVGITLCTPSDPPMSGSQLLERADKALYEAKAAGRNTFKVMLAAQTG